MSSDELELHVAWNRAIGASPLARSWFDAVVGRYREPHRYYHDVRHVVWVVRHITTLLDRFEVDDPGAVIAAAFFHDAVYDPTRADNEAISATLAEQALAELGWQPTRVRRVVGLIEATATHECDTAAELATAVLVAADLAVFAASPERYADYVRNVRREYAHVDDDSWRRGRTEVLRTFLDRAAIFPSALELDPWETRARANIAAELAAMGTIDSN